MMKTTTLALGLFLASGAGAPAISLAAGGPAPVGNLRIVTPDGATVIAQAALSTGTGLNTITIDASKAFQFSNGRCAFNVKYDERSDVAVFGTVNQIHDNDVLIAQNSAIDVAPGVTRTVWTQPYLQPGVNNLRLTIDVNGAAPAKAWVRVQVNGACEATTPPPPPPPAFYQPGTPQWQSLYNAWGYSNYARNKLADKGYPGYADLVAVNDDLSRVVKAGKVQVDTWQGLMKRWNAIVSDPAFQDLMKSVVPGGDGNGTTTGTGGSGGTTVTPPPPPPPVIYAPGSTQWRTLYNDWGYSNYATKQLKGQGYAKYDDIVAVNAELTRVVNAGKVTADTWKSLTARWDAITSDPAFQALIKSIVPTGDGH